MGRRRRGGGKEEVELTLSGWTPRDFFLYADLISFSVAAGVSPK